MIISGRMAAAFGGVLLAGLSAPVSARADAGANNAPLFADHFETMIAGRWEQLKFGKPTEYFIAREPEGTSLKAVADKTCSALMAKVDIAPPTRLIARWKWRIDQTPPNGTDRIRRSFDHTARIIIAFDTFIGPPRTLNYVWANQEKIGADFPHPLSGRAQMIAVETGDERAGQWITEERDVTADWHRLFGGAAMPRIVAIGVITDSEATGTKVTGGYQDLELLSR